MTQKEKINELIALVDIYKDKADKWDALDKKIGSYYIIDEEDESNFEENGNLLDIGEDAARAFGYL